ncbi:hypothetical protein Goarm_014617 [Gossypium armourianum]|uniref:non-specific serine/threonine protein kinase n=1 Tax=Gossypium armourianum TaxID=34283 RepID=A0A7J9J6R7_9ROSI|nr:hypothetical protein [Gossypium armourianum]
MRSGTITVLNQCDVFGYCGNMGICSYSDTSPICGCPSENFRLLDVNDLRQGCKRKRNIEDCPGSAAMLELDHAESFTYPPELSSQTFVGISACRLTCLVTASCVASTSLSDGTGLCYLKTTEFVSGYQVCGPVLPNPSPFADNDGMGEFKEKLGARGFGAVYKGVLSSRAVVAVKQLEGIEQGEKQFRMEVATISSTHHLNLVRLIGFCAEGHHRLLVYEFMKNGSLDNFLFTTEEHSGKMLSWEYRYNVALGTTGGIMYLHEECRDCVIHCDIKPENTLLDEIFNAKVSDFGLAKVINPKDNRYRILTSVREARSYLVPEWLANLPITSKSDVIAMGWYCLR